MECLKLNKRKVSEYTHSELSSIAIKFISLHKEEELETLCKNCHNEEHRTNYSKHKKMNSKHNCAMAKPIKFIDIIENNSLYFGTTSEFVRFLSSNKLSKNNALAMRDVKEYKNSDLLFLDRYYIVGISRDEYIQNIIEIYHN